MNGRSRAAALDVPTESVEQQRLFQWAAYQAGAYPELRLMYHIPNGGSRSKSEAGRFMAEGVKSGVPDICLPVARGGHHGMYIELKRIKGGRISANQAAWIERLTAEGYCAAICNGWETASEAILRYLREE